ncbi:hypothetical protein BDZ97DRAFT_28411 [Flammula alnicola]|nr:hypothetical protein BDZ97DRAFT_28411 [Flammula alnicola]
MVYFRGTNALSGIRWPVNALSLPRFLCILGSMHPSSQVKLFIVVHRSEMGHGIDVQDIDWFEPRLNDVCLTAWMNDISRSQLAPDASAREEIKNPALCIRTAYAHKCIMRYRQITPCAVNDCPWRVRETKGVQHDRRSPLQIYLWVKTPEKALKKIGIQCI